MKQIKLSDQKDIEKLNELVEDEEVCYALGLIAHKHKKEKLSKAIAILLKIQIKDIL
jgi:calcineurin-like phosphoesterase family protein